VLRHAEHTSPCTAKGSNRRQFDYITTTTTTTAASATATNHHHVIEFSQSNVLISNALIQRG
jgi:hypothetical protein